MDVPAWHPANANSNALRRQALAGGAPAKRVEFTVMAGSTVDTSTEAEKQLVTKEESALLGGGRGLLDPSDRLGVVCVADGRKTHAVLAALQTFRSNALKVQAHKMPLVPPVPSVSVGKKPAEKKHLMVVKAKKRQAPLGKETKLKKTKTDKSQTIPASPKDKRSHAEAAKKAKDSKKSDAAAKPPAKSAATALLLQDYSSSDDE
ncbi:unnamed protein product [Phytophthora lilii]|uniref:Unnamed protein product n=1 Tax=Phytophthora lilii TaxID=2077276 RepID=A0A9W6YHG9_9STRA|nr:unnamed protein product [Phytophthora lilii]